MRAWAANLLGAGVAVATLGVGLVVGAPPVSAGGPANPVRIAPPQARGEATNEVGLAESMQLYGRPARLSMFWTADPADQVIQYYADAWKGAANPPVIHRVDKVSSISEVDQASGLMRTVTVTDLGDQRVVMPSVMDVRAFPDLSARTAPVPIPSDAHGYLAQVADDAHSISYHATFAVPLSPARAVDFYRQNLAKLHYQPEPSGVRNTPKLSMASFVRGPEKVNVVALPTQKEGGNTAFVMVDHVRQIAEGGQ